MRAAGVARGLTGRDGREAGPEAGQGSEIESFRGQLMAAALRSRPSPWPITFNLEATAHQKRAGLAALLHQGPAGHCVLAMTRIFSRASGAGGCVEMASKRQLNSPPR